LHETAVLSSKGQIWDIKILKPNALVRGAGTPTQP
jgi:hypothetical protein